MEKKLMNLMFFILVMASFTSCKTVDPDETSETNPAKDPIVRKKQREIMYDCAGQVVSDKIVTINSLSKIYKIAPDNRSNLWSFRELFVSPR